MDRLLVIDMQNDFINGVLGTAEAQALVHPIAQFIRNFHGERVIFTQDEHDYYSYEDTNEGAHIPFHCEYGSDGWKINQELIDAAKDWYHERKRDGFHVSTYTWAKSEFGDISLAEECGNRQKTETDDADTIWVCGVCTDICVIANAMLIKAWNPDTRVVVIENLCAGTTPEKHNAAIEVMKSLLIETCSLKTIPVYENGELTDKIAYSYSYK